MLFCVRQIKVWYKTCANNWPTTGPPKASFRCDGDNDGGTDDDRDDDHEDGYDDEDNEEETSEVDEHQGFFRHVRKHRSPKTNPVSENKNVRFQRMLLSILEMTMWRNDAELTCLAW